MKQNYIILFLIIIIFLLVIYILSSSTTGESELTTNLTEEELLSFFQERTVEGNHAVAIMLDFAVPQPGTAYLGTIHGYTNNLQVCEELIEPYNNDPSITIIQGSSYYCEELR